MYPNTERLQSFKTQYTNNKWKQMTHGQLTSFDVASMIMVLTI